MHKAAVLLISVLVVFIFVGIVMVQSLMIVQRIATVSEVVPPVWVKSHTDGDFRTVDDRAMVRAGDLVKTGPDAKVTLNWVDGSRIRLAPATTLKVLKCTLNKSNDAKTSLFHLDVGSVWIRLLEVLGGRSKFEISTPTATAGVRGTVFSVEVNAQGDTQVSVHEGSVAVRVDGQLLEADAGENALIGRQSRPNKHTMTQASAAAWAVQSGIISPRLQLTAPVTTEFAPDADTVTVAGIAEPGAWVSVNGQPAQLGRDSRFQLDVPFDMDQSQLKIVVTVRDRRGAETSQDLVVTRTQ